MRRYQRFEKKTLTLCSTGTPAYHVNQIQTEKWKWNPVVHWMGWLLRECSKEKILLIIRKGFFTPKLTVSFWATCGWQLWWAWWVTSVRGCLLYNMDWGCMDVKRDRNFLVKETIISVTVTVKAQWFHLLDWCTYLPFDKLALCR